VGRARGQALTNARLFAAVGIRARESGGAACSSEPYNLLATRRWLWLVPRGRPEWRGIAVNALGFAGALLVPDEDALARLREVGPLAWLRAVTPGGEQV